MAETKASNEHGPMNFRNWRRFLSGYPCIGVSEVPLHSDANVFGEIREGLGPYKLLNAIPADLHDPAVVLVVDRTSIPTTCPR